MQTITKNILTATLITGAVTLSSTVMASDDRHFKGEKVETLAEAVKQFSAQNQKFAQMIQDGTIDLKEMGEIHMMTYTMENAMKKIKKEVDEMEELLEEVHEASEHGETEKVLKNGQHYLEKAQTLVP